jgi:aspartate 1-decarboxylase
VNGARRTVSPGDSHHRRVHLMDEAAARRHEPKVVFVDERNRVREKRAEIPGPRLPERVDIGFRTTE